MSDAATELIFKNMFRIPATDEEMLPPAGEEIFNHWSPNSKHASELIVDPDAETHRMINAGDPRFARTQMAAQPEPRFRFTKRTAAAPVATSVDEWDEPLVKNESSEEKLTKRHAGIAKVEEFTAADGKRWVREYDHAGELSALYLEGTEYFD